MSFISKTIRDKAILGKFRTLRVLSSTPLAPLKNFDFSYFRLPMGPYHGSVLFKDGLDLQKYTASQPTIYICPA